jgi:sugar O-acyltransferase (sialic acid O-acetyltransferase NeuD family)
MGNHTTLVLVGGGGHCKSVIDVIEADGRYEIAGILDKTIPAGERILGHQVLGGDDLVPQLVDKGHAFLITVGQLHSADIRKELYRTIKNHGGSLPVIISPRARVSPHAEVGEGTVVHHSVVINAEAIVGRNCIVNTGAIIEHGCRIGEHCHISTGVVINGQVVLGSGSFVGSKSVVVNNITIGNGVFVGAGSVVISGLSDGSFVYGNPAKERTKA